MKLKGIIVLLVIAYSFHNANSQSLYRKVLFLGNSYTYVNNLPLQFAQLADAAGDSAEIDLNAPGGYTLGWQPNAHFVDPNSLALIAGNDWDYVVLQEQSQIPSISVLRDSCMFPGSQVLHNASKASDPSTKVLFYLTWGRRFGGMQCFTPNYCSTDFTDYYQMQDSVTVSYLSIADSLDDAIAPVGEAWRFVIQNYGMVLHDQDNSHPNLKGSYLAACVFYCSVFGKHVTGNTFTAGLLHDTALILQQAADSIVFGYWDLWNLGSGPGTGISNAGSDPGPVFYYDKSTGIITIKGIYSDGMMEVYDLSGRKVRSVSVVAGKGNVEGLVQGVYICRCRLKNTTVTGKISVY